MAPSVGGHYESIGSGLPIDRVGRRTRLRTSAACMTILDFPSEHPPPADSQVDAEAVGMHSGEDEDEQSAAAALLGMAAALPMYSLSQYSPGSAKRQLLDDRQLLSNSRGGSSDDLSSIYSSDGGSVKRQRAETKDHGGAHTSFPVPRRSCLCHLPTPPFKQHKLSTRPPPRLSTCLPAWLAWPPAFGVGPDLSHNLTLPRRAAARHVPVPVQVSRVHEDARRPVITSARNCR